MILEFLTGFVSIKIRLNIVVSEKNYCKLVT